MRTALALALSLVLVSVCSAQTGLRTQYSTFHHLPSFLDLTVAIGPADTDPNELVTIAELGRIELFAEVTTNRFFSGPQLKMNLSGRIDLESIMNRTVDLAELGSIEVSLDGVSARFFSNAVPVNAGQFQFVTPGSPRTEGFIVDRGIINVANPMGFIATVFGSDLPLTQNLNASPLAVASRYFDLPVAAGLAGTIDDGAGLFDPKAEVNMTIPKLGFEIDRIAPGAVLYITIQGELHTAVPEVPAYWLSAIVGLVAAIGGCYRRARSRAIATLNS